MSYTSFEVNFKWKEQPVHLDMVSNAAEFNIDLKKELNEFLKQCQQANEKPSETTFSGFIHTKYEKLPMKFICFPRVRFEKLPGVQKVSKN